MFDTHVYEVLPGEVMFRRSGNGSRTFMRCKIVRTRATAYPAADGPTRVEVSLLVSGSQPLLFNEWFADWDISRDNIGMDKQAGRPVDVAVEAEMLDRLIHTGQPITQLEYPLERGRFRPFGMPLVALRVGERWVEPEPTPVVRS